MRQTNLEWLETLLTVAPATRDWLDSDVLELPYVAFERVAVRLRDRLERREADQVTIHQILAVFGQMAESDDPETHNLLGCGALEALTDSNAAMEALRPLMIGRLRNIFDYTILTWHSSSLPGVDWSRIDLNQAPAEAEVQAALARSRSLYGG